MKVIIWFRILREIRASLEQENDAQRRKIEAINAENLALYKEQQTMRSEKDNEIIQLQTELKLKNFELTSLGASYEVTTILCYRCNDFILGTHVPNEAIST